MVMLFPIVMMFFNMGMRKQAVPKLKETGGIKQINIELLLYHHRKSK